MRSPAGAPPSRRRLLALSAGGAAAGAALGGCALPVPTGVSGSADLPAAVPARAVRELHHRLHLDWGDYFAPQLLLSTDRTTLAVALMTTYVSEAGTPVPELRPAASVMYVVPILLIFPIAQRGFVAGMSTSGLK